MNETNYAFYQAQAQYEGIVAMVEALSVDYDRLDELQDELSVLVTEVESTELNQRECLIKRSGEVDAFHEMQKAIIALTDWKQANESELNTLIASANGCTSEDAAREVIQDDPLEVQVRSGWHSLNETSKSTEFYILLCTGGPAVRIRGELNDDMEPTRVWLEYQDWGTQWTRFFDGQQDVLWQYCQQFYFGG